MSTNDGSSRELPEELERALRRATDRTFLALTSLRKAVRQHVRNGRTNGNDLGEIQMELRAIITHALDELEKRDGHDGHHEALTSQMIAWSQGFYSER